MATADIQTQISAIETISAIGLCCLGLVGLQILLLGFAPQNRNSRITLAGAFALWIGIAGLLAWFTFDPAVRAMKLVASPVMFGLIGVLAAAILFALRRWRKDVYGFVEILVAIGTLLVLGREFDAQGELTIVIAFVGAIYVMVRGLTNISEQWGAKEFF